jgi:hypothetical protein
MKTLEDYEVEIPDYALSYLVNGDSSGLEKEDIETIDNYMQYYYDRAKELNGYVLFDIKDMNDEGGFNHNPEFGLACNTITCIILITA